MNRTHSRRPDPSPDSPSTRLGKDFLRDLAQDYRAFGAGAISDLRKNEPRNYFRLLLSLVPDYAPNQEGWLDSLTDEELDMLLKIARAELARHDSDDNATPPHT